METDIIEKAWKYEEQNGSLIDDEKRPVYHLSPLVGWMNDPNGFCFYKGEYHLFYQYNPYDTVWGPMHWGHAVSKNLLQWKYMKAALAPDSKADNKGCFSGCAVETKDNCLALFYTGVTEGSSSGSETYDVQQQCVAFCNDGGFMKYKDNPVIDKKLLDEDMSIRDFRDPKIIKESDGSYRAFCVNRDKKTLKGQVITFTSNDLVSWKFDRIFCKNTVNLGTMWECPDYFKIDGRDFLFVSAQDVLSSRQFSGGNSGFVLLGKVNDKENFAIDKIQQLDKGIDFYAQQTVLTPDNRRVMIAWLQNWDSTSYKDRNLKWFGQMSVPRELRFQNGILLQQPVREIKDLYGECIEYSNIDIENEEKSFEKVDGILNDIIMDVEGDESADCIEVRLFKKNESYAFIRYDFNMHEAVIDRSLCQMERASINHAASSYDVSDRHLKLRILQDRNSLEVFFGEGELVMSMALYIPYDGKDISFYSRGKVRLSIKDNKIESPKD